MTEQQRRINVKLLSINELAFSINTSALKDEDKDVSFNIGFKLEPTQGDETIDLFLRVIMLSPSLEPILSMESSHRFYVEGLTSLTSKNKDNKTETEGILPQLLNIAVGTVRGIIMAKTAGTTLSKFPLPLVDIDELIASAAKRPGK